MRISDWSSDVCSSDLDWQGQRGQTQCCGFRIRLVGFDADRTPSGLAGGIEGGAAPGERVDDQAAERTGVLDELAQDLHRLLGRMDPALYRRAAAHRTGKTHPGVDVDRKSTRLNSS